MTKISNQDVYIVDTDVSDLDSIIGTDGNTTAKTTKNFLLGKLRAYFKSGLSPLTGGTLRFTEISYTGGLYSTVEGLVNALDPFFVIDQYHVVVVSLNGAKYILKLQDVEVGLDKTPVIAGDFISLPTSAGATGEAGPQGTQGIQGVQGPAGTNGTNGINGIDATIVAKTTSSVEASGTPTVLPSDFNHVSFTNGVTYLPATSEIGKEIVVFTYSDSIVVRANSANTAFMTIASVSTFVSSITIPINYSYRFIYLGSGYWKAELIDGYIRNLQKDASVSFTVSDLDNNYVIQLKNTTDITVTIPDTLATAKFCCGFIRKGVGEVSFVGSGTMVLNNPIGYRINAQYDPVSIERDNAAQICTLLGNTKV